MYFCPICLEPCPTDKHFLLHWKLKHDVSRHNLTLRCRQYNCARIFTDIHNFKRHLLRAHMKDFIFEPYPSIETQVVSSNCEEIRKDVDMWFTDSNDAMIEDTGIHILDSSSEEIYKTPSDSTDVSGIKPIHFAKQMCNVTALFVAKLYANNNLPRNFVQEVIHDVKLILNSVQTIKKKCNSVQDLDSQTEIDEMFEIFKDSFNIYKSEYQTIKYFSDFQYLILPFRIIISSEIDSRRKANKRQIYVKERDLYVISLKLVFTKFLQLPGIFGSILSYIKEIRQSRSVYSILQGEVWPKIEQKFDNIVLPLILYYDEFEVNNPLGTHRGINKLGAVYCSIACIPPAYSSVLENIFLVQLHNANDHKNLGNKIIFSNIIEQLVQLETDGIYIDISGSSQKVYFSLLLITGDNLGLNTILGFNNSFNSNYCCRVCSIEKEDRFNQLIEEEQIIRTADNYKIDVAECSNGVVEECIFNILPNFNVLTNISFDPMHDIFEGICRYESAQILNALINTEKHLSLETLNNRIRFFDFGLNDDINIPPPVNREALNKGCIIYTASEMSCFIKYLGLFIGDLIPEENKIWKLYTLLREIICIIMAPSYSEGTTNLLKIILSEHHALYLELFGERLKPKHHFLLHYPRLMQKMGPPKYISSLRFEAKHKSFKDSAKVITSRKNIAYTLALKQQLQLNFRLMTNKGFEKAILIGPTLNENLNDLQSNTNSQLAFFLKNVDYTTQSWISIDGVLYKPNMILKVNIDDLFSYFGQIKNILVERKSSNVHFVLRKLITVRFSLHLYAFEVALTNELYKRDVFKFSLNYVISYFIKAYNMLYVHYTTLSEHQLFHDKNTLCVIHRKKRHLNNLSIFEIKIYMCAFQWKSVNGITNEDNVSSNKYFILLNKLLFRATQINKGSDYLKYSLLAVILMILFFERCYFKQL
ncbi:uncharacterized protein [Prorops nasuta]|uniref:uncharacterized protein n=1 Tax=Prorops nasuta TaxID=863751 RepID=UPI0034CFE576